jgi:uncharacterized protein (DUF849 family)
MRAAEKVIITTAITGSVNVPSQSPHLPLSADAVAEAAIEAVEAGSAVVHLHAREPDGRPTPSRRSSAASPPRPTPSSTSPPAARRR